jgi:hypothetical protein
MSQPSLSRAEFERLLDMHRRLVQSANALEYALYRLGEPPPGDPINECQQTAGALIGLLRQVLFHHDQEVLPVLASLVVE